MRNRQLTFGLKHWNLSRCASVPPCIRLGATRHGSSPKFPTFHTIKRLTLIVPLSLMLQACTSGSHKEQLIFVNADPDEAFNYPYYLFIPDEIPDGDETVLIVEPNNTGIADDDYEKHKDKARRIASRDFYPGNFVARKLNYPLLVPVFPRKSSEWKIYTHAFDRDVALQKDNPLERIDLQLLAMIRDATVRLGKLGVKINEKVIMTGFSASGSFVNRFTAIHPERIMAVAAGGTNGLLILPIDSMKGKPIPFPLGIGDVFDLFGQHFDSCAFNRTPQYYYIGELDTNDAVPYEDGYDQSERQLVWELLGEEMQPTRWNECIKIYREKKVNAQFRTYKGVGHEITDEIRADLVNFFKQQTERQLTSEKANGITLKNHYEPY